MDVILTLFWIGFIICVAMFVFNIVLGLFFGAIGVVLAGLVSLWNWVFGKN